MVKATELRIGNLIKYNSDEGLKPELINTWVEVTADVIKWASNPSENCYEPITLTPEVLVENCGFDKSKKHHLDYFKWSGNNLFRIRLGGPFKDNDQWWPEVKYLHQLQNLYFALTGEELEINAIKSPA